MALTFCLIVTSWRWVRMSASVAVFLIFCRII